VERFWRLGIIPKHKRMSKKSGKKRLKKKRGKKRELK